MCAMKLMRVDDDGTIKNSDDVIRVQSNRLWIEVIDEFNSAYDREELKRTLFDVIHRVTDNRR